MALTPGTRLGTYEVIALIGEGGMGQVFRATDTKLKRQVAIKILPPALAADHDRLVRFQREAEVLASLNHPNIAGIYGLEESGGVTALVMELVEGDDLSGRITRGAIPLDEVLPIARQIAEALEAAHEQGIIHRDLKPANIKVRADGTVKVLDFGLAKAMEPAAASNISASMSPTLSIHATQAGMILGTAAYMSPEQARGRPVDARADIWAFGTVLFEMLAGRRPFDGEDIVDVLGAVVRLEPDWARLPATVPPRIVSVIRACLQKNVRQRIAHIQDVRLALDGAFEASIGQPADAHVASVVRPPLWRRALPMVATAVVVGSAAAGAAWTLRPQEPRLVVRSTHTLPAGTTFRDPVGSLLVIADDGRQFLYNATGGLTLRSLDSLDERRIPGAQGIGVSSPFFSPDGQSVGYFDLSDRRLRRISVEGGPPQQFAKILGAVAFGASWGRDGTILFGQASGIWQVPENGGEPRRVIATEPGEQAATPRPLPGGDWVLFALARRAGAARWEDADIVIQSLGSGERRVLLKASGNDARYVPSGHLVYAQGAVLFAVPFNIDRLAVTGTAVPVVQGVRRAINPAGGAGDANYGVSTNGTLVYIPGSAAGNVMSTLAWVDPAGRREALNLRPGQYAHPRLSPDGKWLAVERQDSSSADIWLYEISGTTAERRLTEGGDNRYPVWSRDGAYVVFQSDREGDRGVFRQRADGSSAAERLTKPEQGVEHIPEAWSPAEDRLAMSRVSGSSVELWMWTLRERRAERVGALQASGPFDTTFSPDGKWIAYTQREPGGTATYVQRVGANNKYQVGRTEDLVHHPLWSPDGKRLIYVTGGTGVVAASIKTEPAVAIGLPEPLPGLPLNVQPSSLLNHDMGRDGRFVTVVNDQLATGAAATPDQIVIVQNWFEELKRLVPVK
jgi:eukaryotic-like serine/threonine-protein kinase